MLIPQPGDVYLHTEGWHLHVMEVDLSAGMAVTRVLFNAMGAVLLADEAAWSKMEDHLTLVKPEPASPPPPQFKFRFIERILPDLKVMQAFGKQFAMGAGTVEAEYIGSEDVTVLVARGDAADLLKQLGLRVHKLLLSEPKPEN